MKLKFVGTDGHHGLKHGEVYDVVVRAHIGGPAIWVIWYWLDTKVGDCPYSSPAAFAADWAKPGQKVVVRKKGESSRGNV